MSLFATWTIQCTGCGLVKQKAATLDVDARLDGSPVDPNKVWVHGNMWG